MSTTLSSGARLTICDCGRCLRFSPGVVAGVFCCNYCGCATSAHSDFICCNDQCIEPLFQDGTPYCANHTGTAGSTAAVPKAPAGPAPGTKTKTPTSNVIKPTKSGSGTGLVCKLPSCSMPPESGPNCYCCSSAHAQQVRSLMSAKQDGVCRFVDCSDKVFDPKYLYCGRWHADQDTLGQKSTFLCQVPKGGSVWQNVVTQLFKKWNTSAHGPKPVVKYVCEIKQSSQLWARYKQYLDDVLLDNPQVFGSGTKGNVHRRFHGTRRMCEIGTASTDLCSKSNCNVCGILKQGFNKSYFGKRPPTKTSPSVGWGRFGVGHYFTSVSSKAHSYNENLKDPDGLRCLLMCSVVIGIGCKFTQDDKTRTGPPQGFHSVLGETGSNLNHDEVCIYDDEAILPSYLILY